MAVVHFELVAFKTEVGVETAKAQLHRLETRVGQAGFVEVAVGVVARVAGRS